MTLQMTMYDFHVVTLDDLPELAKAAHSGDDQLAQDIAIALQGAFHNVFKKAATAKPVLCLCCDQSFAPPHRPPAAFGLMMESFPDRTKEDYAAVTAAICHDCLDRTDFKEACMAALHEAYPEMSFRDPRGRGDA